LEFVVLDNVILYLQRMSGVSDIGESIEVPSVIQLTSGVI